MHRRNRVRQLACIVLAAFAASSAGCATSPPSRTATPAIQELREDYMKQFPDGPHNDCINRGEVVKGMTLYEVLASWGIPDRRLVADTGRERWVYVILDDLSMDWVCYEYDFTNNLLVDWTSTRSNANGFSFDSVDHQQSAMVLPSWASGTRPGGAPTR